jgi:hypothetical protein
MQAASALVDDNVLLFRLHSCFLIARRLITEIEVFCLRTLLPGHASLGHTRLILRLITSGEMVGVTLVVTPVKTS